MTLRMADGPIANLPQGLDAYAGYVNDSGIGETYPGIVATFPNAKHLSITTNGSSAMCADVENGAMSEWSGYAYGYCAVSNVNALVAQYGRPKRLWTAHYTGIAHLCSPACWPGLMTTADGTQWSSHGNVWDESLLADDFFVLQPVPPTPPPIEENVMQSEVFSFKGTTQLDVMQVAGGALWHKWNQGKGWENEQVGAGLATFVGQPQVAVLGGAVWVSVEDSTGYVWVFEQLATATNWNNSRLS